MNYSRQRELILNELRLMRNHPTAKDVYKEIIKIDKAISLATIYRNLNSLENNKFIKRIKVYKNSDRFDGNVYDHYHLICEKCGLVIDISDNALKNTINELEKITNHVITSYEIVLNTVCSGCLIK